MFSKTYGKEEKEIGELSLMPKQICQNMPLCSSYPWTLKIWAKNKIAFLNFDIPIFTIKSYK